jgi:hypothetical protein
MPKVSEMIVSKFLRKEDIDDDLIVTCKNVALEDMPGEAGEQRWVLMFRELPKGLVLNATTIRVLAKAYGDDTESWKGQKVSLYVDPNVSFRGQVVGGLRLRPLRGKGAAAAVAKLAAVGGDDCEPFSDDIPYGDEK